MVECKQQCDSDLDLREILWKRLCLGLVGLFPGGVFGLFLWALNGWNMDENGDRFFPWVGLWIGSFLGFLVGFLTGGIALRAWFLGLTVGCLSGVFLEFFLGYFVGMCLPAIDVKEQAVHAFSAAIPGLFIGGFLGGI